MLLAISIKLFSLIILLGLIALHWILSKLSRRLLRYALSLLGFLAAGTLLFSHPLATDTTLPLIRSLPPPTDGLLAGFFIWLLILLIELKIRHDNPQWEDKKRYNQLKHNEFKESTH